MAFYQTLGELVEAIKHKREVEVVAMIDNDNVTFYSRQDDYSRDLLELHPYDLQQQALTLLGIESESV